MWRIPRLFSVGTAVAVGAAWRIGVLVVDKRHQSLLLNDSLYYSAQATQLAHGTLFREIFVDRPGAEHGPLTQVLMASVSWVSQPVPWQRLVTVLCGIATIVVLARVARMVADDRAAVLAAWIAALYPNMWMNDGLVMSESVSVLAVGVTLLLALRVLTAAPVAAPRPAQRPAWLTACGASAGLAVLARSELVIMAAGLVALVGSLPQPRLARRIGSAALVALGISVVLLPWVGFNLARFERPVTLTTNDGTTLLGSYCDATFDGREVGGWSLACVVNDPLYSADEEPSVRSERQRSLAIAYARAHKSELPKVITARMARTLDLAGLSDLVHQDTGEERYAWASWAGIVSWWLLAPCAVFGLWRVRGRVRMLLLLPVAGVGITTVLFYGGHRIRSSMEAVVVVAAAVALSGWRPQPVGTDATCPRSDVGSLAVEQARADQQHHHEHSEPM